MRRTGVLSGIRTCDSFIPRLLGLMGKGRWPEGCRGLYFPYCSSLHTFFTTLRPDLLFLDKNLKILRIIPKAGPWKAYFGPKGCRHCLELPEGSAKKRGISSGKRVTLSTRRTTTAMSRR
jgi:uncharacterized membrane protein (UPF0127 family)